MLTSLIGTKIDQSQTFDKEGNRIPVTLVKVGPSKILNFRTKDKEGYDAVRIGLEIKAKTKIREVKGSTEKKADEPIVVSDAFQEGDIVKVSGTGKGKGFAGVVKRHHFKGGPRTHGQSDRERAPGSIGSTTTPGRVYKGKRMAGRMGGDQRTVKNLKIEKIDNENNIITVKGLIPGPKNGLVTITKM